MKKRDGEGRKERTTKVRERERKEGERGKN